MTSESLCTMQVDGSVVSTSVANRLEIFLPPLIAKPKCTPILGRELCPTKGRKVENFARTETLLCWPLVQWVCRWVCPAFTHSVKSMTDLIPYVNVTFDETISICATIVLDIRNSQINHFWSKSKNRTEVRMTIQCIIDMRMQLGEICFALKTFFA